MEGFTELLDKIYKKSLHICFY